MGNGARVASIAIWTYVLNLPSDLYLILDDCCYVLTLMKSFFQLFEQERFLFTFCNNDCYMMSFMLVVY